MKIKSNYIKILTCFTSLFTVFFILYFTSVSKSYAKEQINLEDFNKNLTKKDFYNAKKTLIRLLNNLYSDNQKKETIIEFFSVLELSNKDFYNSIKSFNAINYSKLVEISSNIEILDETNRLSREIENTKIKLNKIQTDYPEIKKDKEKRISDSINYLQSSLDELSDFLGLNRRILEVKNGNYIYKNGILKDLPLIKEFPNNIYGLNNFKVALKEVNGSIQFKTNNHFKEFHEKINDIKIATGSAIKLINKHKSELKDLEKSMIASNSLNYKYSKLWNNKVRTLFLDIITN